MKQLNKKGNLTGKKIRFLEDVVYCTIEDNLKKGYLFLFWHYICSHLTLLYMKRLIKADNPRIRTMLYIIISICYF